jgi:hypothetical protein
VYGGSDGTVDPKPASGTTSGVWWYGTGAAVTFTGSLSLFGGNATSGTAAFTGDTHVTLAGLYNGNHCNSLIAGSAGQGDINGNTNVDINWSATYDKANSKAVPLSNGSGNIIGGMQNFQVNSADSNNAGPDTYGSVLGGTANGTVTGNTHLSIQNTGQNFTIGSLAWWNGSGKAIPLANQQANNQGATDIGAGFVSGGSANGTVNGNTNLSITKVGSGTWIPSIYGGGAGQYTYSASNPIFWTQDKPIGPVTINGNVVNTVTATNAVYGIYYGGVMCGNILGSVTNTFAPGVAAWGMNITNTPYKMTNGSTTGSNRSNQNANFGENILGGSSQGGVYGSFIGGSLYGNIGSDRSKVAISNYFDDSQFTDGLAFFTGANDNVTRMGAYGGSAAIGSQTWMYGTSAGTITGDIVNTVKAGTSINGDVTAKKDPGTSTGSTTGYNSWAGDLEGFAGGNGYSAVPLTGADVGVLPSDNQSLQYGTRGFTQMPDASNLALANSGTPDNMVSSTTAAAKSVVNGNIYSTLRSGIFSIGNSADNGVAYSKTTGGLSSDNFNHGQNNTWQGVVRGGSVFGYDNGQTMIQVGTEGLVTSTWGWISMGATNNTTAPSALKMTYDDSQNWRSDSSGFEITASGSSATAHFETSYAGYLQNGASNLIIGVAGQANTGTVASSVWAGAFNGYQNATGNGGKGTALYINAGIVGMAFGGGRNPGVQFGDSQLYMKNGQVDVALSGGFYDTGFQVGNANTQVDNGVINGSVYGNVSATGAYSTDGWTTAQPYKLIGNSSVLLKGGDYFGTPPSTDLSGKTFAGGCMNGKITGSTSLTVDARDVTKTLQAAGNSWTTLVPDITMAFAKGDNAVPISGGGAPLQYISNNQGDGQETETFVGSGKGSTISTNIIGNTKIQVLAGTNICGDESPSQGHISKVVNTNVDSNNIYIDAPMDCIANVYAAGYQVQTLPNGYNVNIYIVDAGQITNISAGQGYPSQYNNSDNSMANGGTAGGTSLYPDYASFDPTTANNTPLAGSNWGVEDFTQNTVPQNFTYAINFGFSGNIYVSNRIENFTQLNMSNNTILHLNYNPGTWTDGVKTYPIAAINTMTGVPFAWDTTKAGWGPTSPTFGSSPLDMASSGEILSGAQANDKVSYDSSNLNKSLYLTGPNPASLYNFATTTMGDGAGFYTNPYWGGSTYSNSWPYKLSTALFLGHLNANGAVQISTPYLSNEGLINISSLGQTTGTTTPMSITWLAKDNTINVDSQLRPLDGNTNPNAGFGNYYANGYFWQTSNGMPLFTFDNTDSANNGVQFGSPTMIKGFDSNTNYQYGLLSDYDTQDVYDPNQLGKSNTIMSDEIFILPGQIRQFQVNNPDAGNWQLDSSVTGLSTSPTAGSGEGYTSVEVGAKATTITLMYKLLPPQTPGIDLFNFTTNSGYYITDVTANGPTSNETGITPQIYDYATGTTFGQGNTVASTVSTNWPTGSWATSGSPASSITGGALTTFTPWTGSTTPSWGGDASHVYFPTNAPNGTDQTSNTQSRYIIYTAMTDKANTISASNVILTESQAKNLTLVQLEATNYQPTSLTDGSNLTDPVNGTTFGSIPGADVTGFGVNPDLSSVAVNSGVMADINSGLMGAPVRAVEVTWNDGFATGNSNVEIVPDGTNVIDGTAVLTSQSVDMPALLAQHLTSLALTNGISNEQQLATYTQAMAILADGSTSLPPIANWEVTNNGTMKASGTGSTGLWDALNGAADYDVFSVTYGYQIAGTSDAAHFITNTSTLNIGNGSLSFAGVPTSVTFPSGNIGGAKISEQGVLSNDLIISDSRSNASYDGFELSVMALQELTNSTGNQLVGAISLMSNGTSTAIQSGVQTHVPFSVDPTVQSSGLTATQADENAAYAAQNGKDTGYIRLNITSPSLNVGGASALPDWNKPANGLFLNVLPNEQMQGAYHGILMWTLSSVPSNG